MLTIVVPSILLTIATIASVFFIDSQKYHYMSDIS